MAFLIKVFENFGTILEVKIKEDGQAFIIFSDILDAYFAQTYLNNRTIEEDQIKLKVDWCTHKEVVENELSPPKRQVIEENKNNLQSTTTNIQNSEPQFNVQNNLKNEDVTKKTI